jgi:hypothetical protein
MEVYLPGYGDDLLPQAMRTLFPSFDPQTAHLADPPLLPNLEVLHYIGDEIHWALLKSARLQRVYFGRVCNILSDAAPDDVSRSAKMLTMPFRFRILSPGAYHIAVTRAFLAHFTMLETACFDISDYEYDTSHMGSWEDIDYSNQGSWAVLVGLLQPFKTCVKSVHISTMLGGSNHVTILRNTIPCEGFKDFVSLRALHIPYGCLFSTTSQQWSHIAPPPSELLPASLILLYIEYPRITFFDWLAWLPQFHEALPKLSQVQIACSDEVGDSYELFKFIEHDHHGWTALRSIGVQLEIFYQYCWNAD